MLKATKEYTQAFEFDQLNALMKKGTLFEGFHEAPINFPPTFKYDVLRTRRPNHSSSKLMLPDDQSQHPQVEGRDIEGVEDEVGEGTDAASIISSITSVVSRAATEPGVEDDYFRASSPTVVTSTNKLPVTNSQKKHKGKWLSLLSPSFVPSPKLLRFQHAESLASPSTPLTPSSVFSVSPQSATSLRSDTSKKRFLRPPPMILLNPSASQNSVVDKVIEGKRGVYDTSSKKRVPSWRVFLFHY